MNSKPPHNRLTRELGVFGATMMGLGSIVGTGIFVSIGIAAGSAGPSVILAIAIAAIVATCNAFSSSQLAASLPVSGGTYEYGYRYLHPALGFTAGWMFLCAKTASAATAALGFAGYLIHLLNMDSIPIVPIAIVVSVILTLLVLSGLRLANWTNIVIVSVTLITLLLFVFFGLNLILGLSRVVLAMGRQGDLPPIFAHVSDKEGAPSVAVIGVGIAITGLALTGSVEATWAFSAFSVLIYYSITNLAALYLPKEDQLYHPAFAIGGLIACLFLAFWVPLKIWIVGLGLIIGGLIWHVINRFLRRP